VGAEGVRVNVACVRTVMAQSRVYARVHPGVDEGQPGHAERLATLEAGYTGARVGVSSHVGRKDDDLATRMRVQRPRE